MIENVQRSGGLSVESPVRVARSRLENIDIPELLRFGSIAAVLLTVIAFLWGCEAPKAAEAESNSMIQKSDSAHEVHGEVGAIYGASAR